jgi:hypothetical protein
LTLANLYRIYSLDNDDYDYVIEVDDEVRDCLLGSINKRWLKSDQDSFLLAVILNPYIRTSLFKRTFTFATPSGVYSLVKRMWTRFFPKKYDAFLFEAVGDYCRREGAFSDDDMHLEDRLEAAESQVSMSHTDLVRCSFNEGHDH